MKLYVTTHMLEPVSLPQIDLASYSDIVSAAQLRAVRRAAGPLEGRKILHLSAAAEIDASEHQLRWLVPLTQALGIDCEWRTLTPAHAGAASCIADSLLTDGEAASDAALEAAMRFDLAAACHIEDDWDVIVVHGRMLSRVPRLAPASARAWIWRPGRAWHAPGDQLPPRRAGYAAVVTDVPFDSPTPEEIVIPLAVDPLAMVSMPLAVPAVRSLCGGLGLDPERQFLLHSCWHGGSDAVVEVVDAYWAMKERHDDVQLAVLVSADAAITHEDLLADVMARCAEDSDLHVMSATTELEINALRSGAAVVLQPGHAVNWRLDVTEALWKVCPVVRTTGRERLARRTRSLLEHHSAARMLGASGHRMVRRRLLAPTVLREWLTAFAMVLAKPRPASRSLVLVSRSRC